MALCLRIVVTWFLLTLAEANEIELAYRQRSKNSTAMCLVSYRVTLAMRSRLPGTYHYPWFPCPECQSGEQPTIEKKVANVFAL